MNNSTYEKNIERIEKYLTNFKYQDDFLKNLNKKTHPIELRRIIREITRELNELTKYTKELDDYYSNEEKNDKKAKKEVKKEEKPKKEEKNVNFEENDDIDEYFAKEMMELSKTKPKNMKNINDVNNYIENIHIKINKFKNKKKSISKDDLKNNKRFDIIITQLETLLKNLTNINSNSDSD